MNNSATPRSNVKGILLRLFVAGDEPHSRRARDSLKRLCESQRNQPFEVEVVDVLQSYNIALENNIFLTPALIRVSPAPAVTIFGDLSDTDDLFKVLRLGEDA